MSFTATRSKMQSFSGSVTAEYQLRYMSQELVDLLSTLNNKYVEHLTSDLTKEQVNYEFRGYLTNTYYSSSNDHARDCLELCPRIDEIYGRRIKPWTDSALKCFDNFLLKYIQVDRNERIKPHPHVGDERQVYWHLIDLGGELQEIGQAFDAIYQIRNEFQHIQMVDQGSGTRIPRRMNNRDSNAKRDQILMFLSAAISLLMKKIITDKEQ